jgi:hypothetical protein
MERSGGDRKRPTMDTHGGSGKDQVCTFVSIISWIVFVFPELLASCHKSSGKLKVERTL